ncbi:MAG TPA: ATP-binding protein [Polyangiaceae bacterium]|nr:ATP-binding protein [Polyangiaceae bacterium]
MTAQKAGATSRPSEQLAPQPRRTTRPPKNEPTESEGWKSSAQTQRLLHELRVHQIELEMQNEELRVSRAEVEAGLKRYTDLYDFAPVGYLTLSPEGTIRELNLPAARVLGRERSRLLGGRLQSFVSPGTRLVFDSWLTDVFAHQDKCTCEVVLLRDNLPPLSVELEAKLSLDGQSGRAVLTDITSRKILEEELRQAQKMEVIGQLAGGVAHDFNNILAAMMLNLGVLRAEGESPAQAETETETETEAALRNLDALAQRASSLTSQLLLFGRRQVMQLQRLELNGALTHLRGMLERLLGEEISCSLHAAVPELWVDADLAMLEQAVMNLCLNARDAMPNGGTLTLETSVATFDAASARVEPKSRPGQFVCVRVSDTGCGMNADVQKHLFEPFFTTKKLGQGTGLGLASVYGTVQQHQGWLNVESRPEHGTTFRLYLPRSPKPQLTGTPNGAPVDTKGKGETLLLVEDEPALLAIATRALSRLGYRVLPAVDGRQALALWECYANDIDLVLTDMRMPNGISGLALAERLWNMKPSLKIIIMSGYSSELATNGSASQVEFTYLAKPFELQTLAETVRCCLGEAHPRNAVS